MWEMRLLLMYLIPGVNNFRCINAGFIYRKNSYSKKKKSKTKNNCIQYSWRRVVSTSFTLVLLTINYNSVHDVEFSFLKSLWCESKILLEGLLWNLFSGLVYKQTAGLILFIFWAFLSLTFKACKCQIEEILGVRLSLSVYCRNGPCVHKTWSL